MGASAGGLQAFLAFLAHLPQDSGLAFVLVPHLSPDHVRLLTDPQHAPPSGQSTTRHAGRAQPSLCDHPVLPRETRATPRHSPLVASQVLVLNSVHRVSY
ncbi:chemotaxis protein CheB [Aminobacter aminovorans]|uniref:chemotaxis protein CheB n=1 Tax=Aminobacter aminovorans TaxID=83263 RepID=UPI0038D40F54